MAKTSTSWRRRDSSTPGGPRRSHPSPDIAALGERLRAETAGAAVPTGGDLVLRAFARRCRRHGAHRRSGPVPDPGHPIGLSFAVDAHVRPLPRSLQNIYRELADDLGIAPAPHGDLSAWSDQGVMLLNRVLTVAPGRRHPTADGGGRR
jgi:uracil-DNA glycosylase